MSSVDWATELSRTWAVLGTPGKGVSVSPIGDAQAGRVMRVGVSADGARHFLVPAPPSVAVDETRAAVSVTCSTLVFDGTPERLLDVACIRSEYFDLFDDLLVSMLPEVASATDMAVAALQSIDRWRELLRARRAAKLTVEQKRGLFAELWCMRRLIALGAFDRADQWRGPLREPHDFDFGASWIEVKAVGATSTDVKINGIEQLSTDDGRQGWLAVLELTEDRTAESLPMIAAAILNSIGDSERGALEDLLVTSGAMGGPSDERWSVAEVFVLAAASCPRLTPAMIGGGMPVGVHSVRYSVERTVIEASCGRGVSGFDAVVSSGVVA